MPDQMTLEQRIDAFLAGTRFAVVGASTNRQKYGNKVLRVYKQAEREVVAINPRADQIEGIASYPGLSAAPQPVDAVSIITPPKITEQVVDDAIELGIKHLWMQPGAESQAAVDKAQQAGINVIAGDACVLVVLGFREDAA